MNTKTFEVELKIDETFRVQVEYDENLTVGQLLAKAKEKMMEQIKNESSLFSYHVTENSVPQAQEVECNQSITDAEENEQPKSIEVIVLSGVETDYKADIVDKIKGRVQSGKSLFSHVVGKQDKDLYLMAVECFGSWNDAVEESGFTPQTRVHKVVSKQDAKKEVLFAMKNNQEVRLLDFSKDTRNAIMREWRGWKNLMRNIKNEEKRNEEKMKVSEKTLTAPVEVKDKFEEKSKEQKYISKEIRKRVKEGQGIDADSIFRDDQRLFRLIKREFGSVKSFYQAFGIVETRKTPVRMLQQAQN